MIHTFRMLAGAAGLMALAGTLLRWHRDPPLRHGILHLATVPIAIGVTHPDILGTLSVGFLLDDAFAEQLKQVTGSDVAFGMDGQILASTLAHEVRGALAAFLRADEAPQNVTIGLEEYVVLPLRLAPSANPSLQGAGPVALILRSRADQLRFLQAIHTELTVTAIVAV